MWELVGVGPVRVVESNVADVIRRLVARRLACIAPMEIRPPWELRPLAGLALRRVFGKNVTACREATRPLLGTWYSNVA